MHQNCRNAPNATQRDGFIDMHFCIPIVPDGFGEDPEDRTKHDYAARKTEIAHDLEVIAMRVLNQESEECESCKTNLRLG